MDKRFKCRRPICRGEGTPSSCGPPYPHAPPRSDKSRISVGRDEPSLVQIVLGTDFEPLTLLLGRHYYSDVIPAKAGIQGLGEDVAKEACACLICDSLDSRLRGNDGALVG